MIDNIVRAIRVSKWQLILCVLLVIYGLALSATPALAVERIDMFDVSITVHQESQVYVWEKIVYNFGDEQRHGIFRTIPVKYKARGGNYALRISDIVVTDELDKPIPFATSSPGRYIEIKIGDPSATVTGQQTYWIYYTVERAINYFDTHDELYWNVTGTEWPVPIGQISAEVVVPKEVNMTGVQMACFAGRAGSSAACSSIDYQSYPAVADNTILFNHDEQLEPGEGVTLVIGLPKGILREPTMLQRLLDKARDNWVVVVPPVAFIVLLYLWWTRGRDPKGRGTIVPQYEPPQGLTPSQVGTIIDERAGTSDLTSDIVHLAVQGFIRIHRVETKKWIGKKVDYKLAKLREETSLSHKVEQEFMQALFKKSKVVELSDLKNTFHKDLEKIRKELYLSVVKQGYFVRNPRRVRTAYISGGILTAVVGALSGWLWLGTITIVSLVVTGVIIAAFSLVMPVKTKKGVEMKEYILGLKRYLSVAEKDRLAFHNAPEKNPQHFDNLLPYAMVLGVEKQWAKQFAGIDRKPPNWYSDSAGGSFHPVMFAGAMQNFARATNSTLASRPSSAAGGGSGFSGGGGGFGGGSGGSW